MTPEKQETVNGVCSYLAGTAGLGAAHCIDFTEWWHFGIAVLSTILILLQAAHDIPKSIKKFKSWLKSRGRG